MPCTDSIESARCNVSLADVAQTSDSKAEVIDIGVLLDVVDAQSTELDRRAERIKELQSELRLWRQGLFGKRREAIDPNQLRMDFLDTAPVEQDPADDQEEDPEQPPGKDQPRKKGHGRAKFPDHLPREEIRIELPEAEQCCPECGDRMQIFGEEVCERGHIVPARLSVKRYVRPKYACSKGHAVKTAPMPDGVIDGGKYGSQANEEAVWRHVCTR